MRHLCVGITHGTMRAQAMKANANLNPVTVYKSGIKRITHSSSEKHWKPVKNDILFMKRNHKLSNWFDEPQQTNCILHRFPLAVNHGELQIMLSDFCRKNALHSNLFELQSNRTCDTMHLISRKLKTYNTSLAASERVTTLLCCQRDYVDESLFERIACMSTNRKWANLTVFGPQWTEPYCRGIIKFVTFNAGWRWCDIVSGLAC